MEHNEEWHIAQRARARPRSFLSAPVVGLGKERHKMGAERRSRELAGSIPAVGKSELAANPASPHSPKIAHNVDHDCSDCQLNMTTGEDVACEKHRETE